MDPALAERLTVQQGDITRLAVGAVVNAANPQLLPGGGVCGAIHRAAGPELAAACERLGGCPTGEARITPGFDLEAGHVVHAVGPIWRGGGAGEPEQLASCYRHALVLAQEARVESIAFPCISTGIYGYPAEGAARIATEQVAAFLRASEDPARVILCAFSDVDARILRAALNATRGWLV